MAAENVALKAAVPEPRNVEFDNDSLDDVSLAEDFGFNDAIGKMKINMCKTPATDAYLAGIKADGVESGIKTIMTMLNHQAPGVSDAINVLRVHSSELREVAKK